MEVSSNSAPEGLNLLRGEMEIEQNNGINNTERLGNSVVIAEQSHNIVNLQQDTNKTDTNPSANNIFKMPLQNNGINNIEGSDNSIIVPEQNCNIENLQQDTGKTDTNLSINSIPSQQLQNFDSIFSLGGQEFFLNNCGTKRIVVGITSSGMPNLKVTFRLHDLKNGWYIQFNKKTWDTIVRHEPLIIEYMDNGIEEDIFDNNRIRAETQFLYNRCCVQFFDLAETHVALAPETFERMMSLKDEISKLYIELNKKINDVANRMKLFMDLAFFQLFKSNNIDSRHNYNWAMLQISGSSTFMELNNAIANTWEQLGKWISNEQTLAATDDL